MSLKCAQNYPVTYSCAWRGRVFVSNAVLIEVGTLRLLTTWELNPCLDPQISLRCQLHGREMEKDGWERNTS